MSLASLSPEDARNAVPVATATTTPSIHLIPLDRAIAIRCSGVVGVAWVIRCVSVDVVDGVVVFGAFWFDNVA
jgi:coenzyme F420-reducing hydrogenase delta subunit